MKARKYYFLILVLIGSFLTMDYFLNKKINHLMSPDVIHLQSVVKNINKKTFEKSEDSESLLQFKSDFKYEVNQIGQTQTNTDEIENRLQGLARQMEPEHRDYLKFILNSQDMNGDDRAMAIELLSRNQTLDSAEILKNYTTNEPSTNTTRAEQELVFKAQAIEGLAAYQDRNVAISYLKEINKKTNYKFLQDRAQRAESALKNEGPPIEAQDLEALKKIIR